MNIHLKNLLIIIIISVTFMCINMDCKEHFYTDVLIKTHTPIHNNKLFNIDSEIDKNKKYFEWKSFWRSNFNNYDNNLNNIYKNPEYSPFKKPLLYDSIKFVKTPF